MCDNDHKYTSYNDPCNLNDHVKDLMTKIMNKISNDLCNLDNDHENTRNDHLVDPVNYLFTIIIQIKIRNYHCNLVNYV